MINANLYIIDYQYSPSKVPGHHNYVQPKYHNSTYWTQRDTISYKPINDIYNYNLLIDMQPKASLNQKKKRPYMDAVLQ